MQSHSATPRVAIRAAQYVRMSTDHQRYSIDNQVSAIASYASQHNIEIVRTYADEGRSGVRLKGRLALTELLADVRDRQADYKAILVYDISRWGRFQDSDESAYYEFVCKLAGIEVIYCAEPFKNDGGMPAALLKVMKRVMAGEYSRELSVKVSRAHRQQAALGYHQGGPANYGLRRAVIGPDGARKVVMERRQAKTLQTDKVVLVPGPDDEIEVVRNIFKLYVHDRLSFKEIATALNQRGLRNGLGNAWTLENIIYILRSEKYAGTFTFGMTRWPLLGGQVGVPKKDWIRIENAIAPIIDQETFDTAQLLLKDGPTFTDNELLDYLSAAWCILGLLSAPRLNTSEFSPTHHTYFHRFGGLTAAYKLIGYKQTDTYRYTHAPNFVRVLHRKIIGELLCINYRFGQPIAFDLSRQVLTIFDRIYVSLAVLQHLPARGRLKVGWALHLNNIQDCDAILVVRMNASNTGMIDYHLIPRSKFTGPRFRFSASNMGKFRHHKLASLSSLPRFARRMR
jgi:DNA invertase Pin-like site-specific DNA recombinase